MLLLLLAVYCSLFPGYTSTRMHTHTHTHAMSHPCRTFASAETLESQVALQTGYLNLLSEQVCCAARQTLC